MRKALLCLTLLGLVALTGCTPTPGSGQTSLSSAPVFEFLRETDQDYTGNPRAWVRIDPSGAIITDIQVSWGVGNVETANSLVPYALDSLSALDGEVWRDTENSPYFAFHPKSPILPGHINTPARVLVKWELADKLASQEKLVYRMRLTLATGSNIYSNLRAITPGMNSVGLAPVPIGGEPPPLPGETLPLELRIPENGSICVGDYIGFEGNDGEANVTFKWHEEGGITHTTLDGDFHILIEPVGTNGCSQAERNDPNPDVFEPDRCIIQPTHSNGTAQLLLPAADYQWQVRRVVGGDLGPWTQPSTFTTASYVAQTPTFFDPNGDNTNNYPTQGEMLTLGTAVAAVVQVRWTPVGCNPRRYAIHLFKDGDSNWSQRALGSCVVDTQTNDRTCEADLGVKAGSSYRLELNQGTDFGDIDAVLSFSVAESP